MRPGEDARATRRRVRREFSRPVPAWKKMKRLKHYLGTGTEEPGVLVEMVVACYQLRANIDGVEAEILQRLQDVRPTSALGEELATRLAIPTGAADRMLDRAAALDDYPEVHFALLGGEIDQRKADTFIDSTKTLPVLEARAVHRSILPDAPTLTYRQLKHRLRAAALAVDGDLAQERHEKTLPDRSVTMSEADDGMAYLTFFLSATDATKAMSVLDALAVKDGPEDDRRIGARRVDAFMRIIDQILNSGRTPDGDPVPTQHRKRPHLVFTVAQSTLDGEDDAPGYLAGYGPLAADIVRHLATRGEGDSSVPAAPAPAPAPPPNGPTPDDGTQREATQNHANPSGTTPHEAAHGALRQSGPANGTPRDTSPAHANPGEPQPRPSGHAGLLFRPLPTCAANGTLLPTPRAARGRLTGDFDDDPVAALEGLGVLASDAYQPGAELREYILARDVTCRFPTCQQPARRCQIDHIVAFEQDKPAWTQTHHGNLHLLCARHHQLKTAGVWSVSRDPFTGDTHWTSPLGYRYTRRAEVVDPSHHLPALHAALRQMEAHHADDHALHAKPAPVDAGLAPDDQWQAAGHHRSKAPRSPAKPRVSVLRQVEESIRRSLEEQQEAEENGHTEPRFPSTTDPPPF